MTEQMRPSGVGITASKLVANVCYLGLLDAQRVPAQQKI